MLDGKAYKDRISAAEENLIIFSKSVEKCNVPVMLGDSFRFLETIKNADTFYFNLPENIQKRQAGLFNKSQTLLEKYFDITSRIGITCECKTSRQRP